jgi:nitric oxide reductase large subunit
MKNPEWKKLNTSQKLLVIITSIFILSTVIDISMYIHYKSKKAEAEYRIKANEANKIEPMPFLLQLI